MKTINPVKIRQDMIDRSNLAISNLEKENQDDYITAVESVRALGLKDEAADDMTYLIKREQAGLPKDIERFIVMMIKYKK